MTQATARKPQMPEVAKAVSDLRAAVSKGNLAKVSALLKGASPTLVDESASLVGVAISRGHLSIATVLLEHGVKPDAVEGGSLLVTALKAGGASLVPPIIAALGASAAAAVQQTRCGADWTPLMYAAKAGALEAISALLEAGADVNAREKQGGTALMLAVQHSQLEAVCAPCFAPRRPWW